MSDKMWAVSSGSYSDYEVHFLFPTEEMAKAAVAATTQEDRTFDAPFVEEFVVCDHIPTLCLTIRCSSPSKQPDRVWQEYEEVVPEWELPRVAECVVRVEKWTLGWSLHVEGTDHERVRKAFPDVRAQLLALPHTTMTAEQLQEALATNVQ